MYENLLNKFKLDANKVLSRYRESKDELGNSSVWITEDQAVSILGLLDQLAGKKRPQSRTIEIVASAVEKAGNYYVPVGDTTETTMISVANKTLEAEAFGWSLKLQSPGVKNQRPSTYRLSKIK